MNILESINNNPLMNLEKVYRYSGIPLPDQENVAIHVIRGISLFYTILPNLKISKKDIKEVVYKFTLHDLPETLTGDIIRKYKYYNEDMLKILRQTERELTLQEMPHLYDDIEKCKDNTLSGALVSILDTLQVIFFLYNQYLKSNTIFIKNKIKNETYGYFEEVLKERASQLGEHNLKYFRKLFQEIKDSI